MKILGWFFAVVTFICTCILVHTIYNAEINLYAKGGLFWVLSVFSAFCFILSYSVGQKTHR